ncbi:unnamed protein product [Callosobruchus maculatus]|uniref:Ig-like domain-containing protein n=1 Tax=Callosobruchus maculatus TaxID=64391 RepID=A0A653CQC7_CALMS|nr:unnamed protein product [Callosobruchus maculatus]
MKVILLAIVLISLPYGECLSRKQIETLHWSVVAVERAYLECYKQIPFHDFAVEWIAEPADHENVKNTKRLSCIVNVFIQVTEEEDVNLADLDDDEVKGRVYGCLKSVTLERIAILPYPKGYKALERCALEGFLEP